MTAEIVARIEWAPVPRNPWRLVEADGKLIHKAESPWALERWMKRNRWEKSTEMVSAKISEILL